jgi:Uma2 family endonuclease
MTAMSIAIPKRRTKSRTRPAAAVPEFPVARMTVPEYLSLVDKGFFGDRRVELWEGWVVDRMPHGSVSAKIIAMLTRWFGKKLSDQVSVRPQLPIQLRKSCPEPDVAIANGPDSIYDDRHPKPDEIQLLIEVADSSLQDDRTIKSRMYAGAGIKEYWIVNCEERQIEVYTDPHAAAKMPRYRKLTTYLPGQTLPVHVAGKKLGDLAVNELFPPKK